MFVMVATSIGMAVLLTTCKGDTFAIADIANIAGAIGLTHLPKPVII